MTVAAPGEPARPASAGMRRSYARVLRQAALMVELAGGPEAELAARAPAVSGWSVAEQLEHLLLVDRGVLKLMGRILDDPRPMPKAAVRTGIPEIERGLRELAPRLGELERSGGRARHPRLGGLGGRQWMRFLAVHHHHHLKIVRDIRRARGLGAIGLPSR